MKMEVAAAECADKEMKFITFMVETLTDSDIRVLQISLKSAYMNGYIHGTKDTNDFNKQ
ncbi:hypothetical protein [Paenibacillus paridis]|uniref:hypothetical protein n=1 Tax=Paenibacillus paridis TaxID=2583376 RepID=UPI00139075C7|nr:hypothetical protein [Paenibacillus paridis]